MNPQGASVVNVDQFKNLTASIKGAESCEELQKLVNEAFASIKAVEDSITAELAKINALLALLTPPGLNFSSIVTWIKDFITNFLTPYLKPSVTFSLQLTEILNAINELKSAIDSVRLSFSNCHISFPS